VRSKGKGKIAREEDKIKKMKEQGSRGR